MKLIIQIPCFNEEQTIGISVDALPKEIEGVDIIEYLIIDDGSTDDTILAAKQAGVHHIINHTHNRGLAAAFMTGLNAAIALDADIIVNTDADNQYDASYIKHLVAPIISAEAEIVIGTRPISTINEFSALKKKFQHIGSAVVRAMSNTNIEDAPSGFRAFSREAALRLNVFGTYTYTLETIIQAGLNNMSVVCVPVEVNGKTRESRLMKNPASYVLKSAITIVRVFAVYKPFKFFCVIGSILFGLGTLISLRYLFLNIAGDGEGHVQSLILSAILILMGMQAFLAAFVADFVSANRKILEEVRYLLRFNKYNKNKPQNK